MFKIRVENDEYKADYDFDNNVMNVFNKNISIKMSLNSKRLFIYTDKQYVFVITDDNILRNKDIRPYYNLIYKIMIKIKTIC